MSNIPLGQRLEEEGYEDVVIFSSGEFDDAFLGLSEENRAIYSFDKMVDWLIKLDGITYEEAVEYIEFNVVRALPYAGEKAPIILYEWEGE